MAGDPLETDLEPRRTKKGQGGPEGEDGGGKKSGRVGGRGRKTGKRVRAENKRSERTGRQMRNRPDEPSLQSNHLSGGTGGVITYAVSGREGSGAKGAEGQDSSIF